LLEPDYLHFGTWPEIPIRNGAAKSRQAQLQLHHIMAFNASLDRPISIVLRHCFLLPSSLVVSTRLMDQPPSFLSLCSPWPSSEGVYMGNSFGSEKLFFENGGEEQHGCGMPDMRRTNLLECVSLGNRGNDRGMPSHPFSTNPASDAEDRIS
jgi:hypothetical protein